MDGKWMNSEAARIASQLCAAFTGDPWHGSPVRDLLAGVTAGQALARPLPSAHNIWELVLHIELYVRIALVATRGDLMPELFGTEKDWPEAAGGEEQWSLATRRLFESCEELAAAIEEFDDARLQQKAPGRQYNFYFLFHGIVQHSLYHAGQIAILKKASARPDS